MDYSVEYSKRKTLSLRVKEGKVMVKAPFGTPKYTIISFVDSHIDWIESAIYRTKKMAERFSGLSDSDIERLKAEAKNYFTERVEYYSRIMKVSPSSVKITSAKTRFGSCNSRGNICFSYRLMLFPIEARDYVVVHELAHLYEMNHSKQFYRIVASVMPDYMERKKLLKN